MEGKLCITRIDQDHIEGYFIAPRREEYVKIKKEMISVPVTPGHVLRVDYSWTSVAVFEVLAEKFFPVEASVTETSHVKHIQIASSQEEASQLFVENLQKNFHQMKPVLEEDIKRVSLDVEAIPPSA